uniref:G-protein coupled receptors family 1 profile domain-containing protein n=1 Tax=Globodera rostochiensis TaxID=31243 RepID=A0A914HCY9_GLORO
MNDEICLPYELLRLHGSPLEGIFFTFLFPWLFLFGLVGNCLNLMVLLNPGRGSIRRRSDSLLIALAFCDVLFLLLLLPSAMAQFDSFGQNPRFRLLYLSLRVHLVALANWCSAVAIWLIIAICADRLLAIRSSLRLHSSDSSQWAIIRLVFGIVLLSGLLTSYNHFSYHCVLKFLCGHSQVIGKCFNVLQESWPGNHTNLTPHPLRAYVRWSMAANALLVIVLPVLLMLFLNASLLVAVRRNSFHLQCPKKSVADRKRRGEEMRNGAVGGRPEFGRSVDQSRAEHRVTVGLAAIVSCFTLTQGPSALVLLANLVVSPPSRDPLWWDTVGSMTCFLVIVGKTLNCVLLCLASSAFRRRLVQTLLGRRASPAAAGEGKKAAGLVTNSTRRSSSGASTGERRMKIVANAGGRIMRNPERMTRRKFSLP